MRAVPQTNESTMKSNEDVKIEDWAGTIRAVESESSSRPYLGGTWDCSYFTLAVVEKALGKQLSEEDKKAVLIDYDLSEFGSDPKSAYNNALAASDPRLRGAPGWLVSKGLAKTVDLGSLTEKDTEAGVPCQISWQNGGGHAGFVTGLVKDENNTVIGIKVVTAHSTPNPENGENGAYEANIPLSKIKHIELAKLV
jgi:hypothetical protein